MFRQSPSRNQRPIKVKHVLQICVLLAVCFWLIYQVKHSHDKKKEFDESSAKFSLNKGSSNEVLRLGRKDIQPRVEESTLKKEKHDEEAEEEETTGQEMNKDEEEEQDEDNQIEDKEDEGKEDGDDEIDEHDKEKSDGELDHEDNLLDEDKEKEEFDAKEIEDNDVEGKNNQMETESALEEHDHDHDHDHDGAARNTHEAREEHYKADDASSAVTLETQTLSNETENGNSDVSKQHGEMNISEQEKKLNNTEELNFGQGMTELKLGDELKVVDGEMIQNSSPIATAGNVEKHSESLSSESKDGSSSNLTTTKEVGDQPGRSNNSTEMNGENDILSLQNETEKTQALNGAQNVTVEDTTAEQDAKLLTTTVHLANNSTVTSNNNSTVSTQTLDIRAPPRESPNNLTDSESAASEEATSSNSSAKVDDTSGSSTVQINTNTAQNEKSDTSNSTDEVERSPEPLKNENVDVIHDDPIDINDSSIPLEEQVGIDLETLPEMRNEVSNIDDDAVE